MSGYIITPVKTSKKESVELIREIAKYIGSTRITIASPEEHDSVIAYTSDLMHIAASALCLSYPEKMNRAYTAGSFRDCTRVARINPKLWSELFLANRKNVLNGIDPLKLKTYRKLGIVLTIHKVMNYMNYLIKCVKIK